MPQRPSQKRLKHVAIAASASLALTAATTPASATDVPVPAPIEFRSGACSDVPSANYLCGPLNAEELVQLEGTPWIFASQLVAPFITKGTIYLVNGEDRTWAEIPIDGISRKPDKKRYPDCPGPITAAGFRGHGMNFGPGEGGKHRLYAINHGSREAIEIFEVSASGKKVPDISWVGCIPSPDGDYLNTVTVMPGERVIVSKFYEVENKGWYPDMMAGRVTGQVFAWQAGQYWRAIPQTFMSGANGVIATDDGRSLVVSEWGAHRIHKVALDGSMPPVTITVPGRPDNIHRAGDGRLLVVLQIASDLGPLGACMAGDKPICAGPSSVIALNPETMAFDTLATVDDPAFGYGTSALEVGDKIWIGNIRGNKIAIRPKE